ncbi:MAG: hypothetical protein CME36_12200 [unclassified Hahellaceae]|nr:hypothetical protein [Hahellaceae bacterium]|tara:strand:+ start:139253 stop:140128 length:876 start_codon:yes stop_codon:yes gene_type:complete
MKQLFIASLLVLASGVQAETKISDPDWTFKDDFEGARNANFWTGGHMSSYGQSCPGTTGTKGAKTVTFTYDISDPKVTEPDDSWAEFRFKLPFKTTQLEMSYDLYVPANYTHAINNHKFFEIWGGTYGGFRTNVQIGSESWGTSGGATPSLNLAVDKFNMGHSMLATKKPILKDKAGTWQRIQVYIELATGPGDYGKVEIYKNGEFFTGTHHPDIVGREYAPPLPQQIKYSTMGNALEQGYLLGWMNGGPLPGVTTVFCIDNFEMNLREAVGSANRNVVAVPSPPADLKLD